jgi:hypothetical protein
MTAQQNSKNQQAHKDINTSQARQSITKTIERIQNIAQYDPNNKKNPRAVAKERKEAIDNFVKEETERVYNRLAKGDGLEAHFRSIGRLLTHYNKKNQVFIKAQRPDTAGVASRGTWERHGYTIPNGTRPITVTQSYKYVLNNSRHVNDWLKENPLLDIVKWYQSKIKTTKQPQLFIDYILKNGDIKKQKRLEALERGEKIKKSGFEKLATDIRTYIKKYTGTDTPDKNLENEAKEFYLRRYLTPVVRGISIIKPEEKLARQKDAEQKPWFLLPPWKPSKTFLDLCAQIYAFFIVPQPEGSKAMIDEQRDRSQREFIQRYNTWHTHMHTRLKEAWINSCNEWKRRKDAGEELRKEDAPGGYPVLISPSFTSVYAYEDVTPGEKAKAFYATGTPVKCDEELYKAVRDAFRTYFPISEIQGEVPKVLQKTEKSFSVSLMDSPEDRIVGIAREWARQQCEAIPKGKETFRELLALSVLSGMGLDNPHIASVAAHIENGSLGEEDIRIGLQTSSTLLPKVLGHIQRRIGKVIDNKMEEYMNEQLIKEAEKAERIQNMASTQIETTKEETKTSIDDLALDIGLGDIF